MNALETIIEILDNRAEFDTLDELEGLEFECPECGELTNDIRGDWCKDCDKQGGN